MKVDGAEGRVGVSSAGVREEGTFLINGYRSQEDEDIPGISLALLSLHCLNLSVSVLRNISSQSLPELPSHGIAIDAQKQVSGPSATLAGSGVLRLRWSNRPKALPLAPRQPPLLVLYLLLAWAGLFQPFNFPAPRSRALEGLALGFGLKTKLSISSSFKHSLGLSIARQPSQPPALWTSRL